MDEQINQTEPNQTMASSITDKRQVWIYSAFYVTSTFRHRLDHGLWYVPTAMP